jgi:hypothetical protein
VLGILIFSNIINYVWYLLNYSILNVYLVLLLINVIDEISKTEKYNEYSLFYYIKYLNLNKDIFEIIKLRSLSSIFSLLIQKILKNINIGYNKNKIKNFAFTIYLYFKHKFGEIKIINLENRYKQNKLNKLKQNYNFINLLHLFYSEISILLNEYLIILIQLDKLKIQQHSKLTNLDLKKIKNLEEFIFLIIKMLLYYLWDFENINKLDKNFYFDNLFIDNSLTILSNYDFYDNDDVKKIITFINKNKIHFFHIHRNKEFYEQFYLYANLLSIYDKTGIIDLGNYKNLENYVEIFLSNLTVLNLLEQEVTDETNELEILKRLNEYKASFIEEWKNSLNKDLEIRNYQRLSDLNEYIVKNIKEK